MCRHVKAFIILACVVFECISDAEPTVWLRKGTYFSKGFANSSDKNSGEVACAQAKKALIEYVFGTDVRVEQNVLGSLSNVSLSDHVSSSSDQVKLVGVSHETFTSGHLTSCVVQYPVSEAELEKKRL